MNSCDRYPAIGRRRATNLRAFFLLAVLCSSPLPIAVAAGETSDVLANLQTEHPRLLFPMRDQHRVEKLAESDALLSRLIEQNHANALGMLDGPRVRYEIPDGKRLLAQSRYCIERVLAMALAFRLSGESRFADGAIQEMLTAARFKDWNPSHFLDTAEMTTALAIGYDWLYDEISTADRQVIRTAIAELGLRQGLKVYAKGNWWVKSNNNWNQVCNGGMIVGALAIAEEEPELAREVIAAALKSIPNGVRVYRPDGAYPEGPSYWDYGTSYTCVTIAAFTTALGTDFGIRETPGLEKTGTFRIQMIGPTGWSFNFADAGPETGASPTMFFFGKLYDEVGYSAWHRKRLVQSVPSDQPPQARKLGRFFPLEIVWFDPRGEESAVADLPLDAAFRGQQEVVSMRSGWEDDAIYVGFKAGDNRTNHGHLDIGSFVLDADGVRWALDLGGDDYNLPAYFGARRWSYHRLTNRSHNTLLIDDRLQNTAAACSIVAFHSTPRRAGAIVDMSEAYQGQAESVVRGIELLDRRTVHVRDEFYGAKGVVQWRMVTAADIELLNDTTARLTQRGRKLLVKMMMPSGARFEVLPNRPTTPQEKQNEGTQILATSIPAQESALSIVLQPTDDEEITISTKLEPLAQWPR